MVNDEDNMAKPLDPKEIVTVQERAISNMLEIEALIQMLVDVSLLSLFSRSFLIFPTPPTNFPVWRIYV
jgi:hypothetical protein